MVKKSFDSAPSQLPIMNTILRITGKFLLTLTVMTILCTVAWQHFVTDTLYHCTDPGWLDFLSPGQWIHDPVPVAHVDGYRTMIDPDTIKAGWSMAGLWSLWCSFTGVSVVVSILLARMPWSPRR